MGGREKVGYFAHNKSLRYFQYFPEKKESEKNKKKKKKRDS